MKRVWLFCMLATVLFGWASHASAACPTIYNGVSYACSVAAGTVTAGVYSANVNSYTSFARPAINGKLKTFASATSPEEVEEYPASGHWGQFMILIDASTVRLVHVKDTNPIYSQAWFLVTNQTSGTCINLQWCLKITQRNPSPVGVDEVTFTGTTDWHVAAEYYRQWAAQQSWYRAKGTLVARNLAFIINGATNAYSFYQTNMQPTVTAFGNIGPKRVGVFMTQYRNSAFDVNYPDYTCKAGANCAAWLQNLKDSTNGFGLPYINGALWDTTNGSYSASNMCLDSGGNPTVFSGNLRYVDPLLASWPTTLRTAFNTNLQATDTSTSEGVYIDVAAAVCKVCYYGGGPWVANYTAWITGVKATLSSFSDKILMAESPGEIYLPYVDIAYLYPPNTSDSTAIGLFGAIYGGVANLHIVGYDGATTDNWTSIPLKSKVLFGHTAVLFSSGFAPDYYLGTMQGAVDIRRYYYGIPTPAAPRTLRQQ